MTKIQLIISVTRYYLFRNGYLMQCVLLRLSAFFFEFIQFKHSLISLTVYTVYDSFWNTNCALYLFWCMFLLLYCLQFLFTNFIWMLSIELWGRYRTLFTIVCLFTDLRPFYLHFKCCTVKNTKLKNLKMNVIYSDEQNLSQT